MDFFSDLMVRLGRDFSSSSSKFDSGAGAAAKVPPKGKSGTLPLTLAGVRLCLLEPYASLIPHFPFAFCCSLSATLVVTGCDLSLSRVDISSFSILG